MADAPFRTGWAVFRAHAPRVVTPATRRRRTALAGAVAVLIGTAVTISELVSRWATTPLPLAAFGLLCIAAVAGCLTAAFVRVVPPGGMDWSFSATGDWRRQSRVARQFAPRPPVMVPEDRDLVLAAVERARDTQVVLASKAVWVPLAWALAVVAEFATGISASAPPALTLLPLLGAFLQSTFPERAVSSLGRMELARRRAEALPVVPPEATPRRPTGRTPSGSKLSLPGD